MRVLTTFVPPLLPIVGWMVNRKYAHIPYHGEHHDIRFLDIFVSRKHALSNRAPVLVYIHGGGWVMGSKTQNGLFPVHFVAQLGWVVVTVDYRFVLAFAFEKSL